MRDVLHQQIERKFDHEYTGWWNPKTKKSEFGAFFVEVIQGTGGYVIPPKGYFEALAKILRERGILLVDDEIQMGFFRAGKLWAVENFIHQTGHLVFGKALTNGLNPLSVFGQARITSVRISLDRAQHTPLSRLTL